MTVIQSSNKYSVNANNRRKEAQGNHKTDGTSRKQSKLVHLNSITSKRILNVNGPNTPIKRQWPF